MLKVDFCEAEAACVTRMMSKRKGKKKNKQFEPNFIQPGFVQGALIVSGWVVCEHMCGLCKRLLCLHQFHTLVYAENAWESETRLHTLSATTAHENILQNFQTHRGTANHLSHVHQSFKACTPQLEVNRVNDSHTHWVKGLQSTSLNLN